MSQGESTFERRRYDRAVLTLPGRYMLADGQEFDCQIVDVSPIGVAIRAPLVGDLGERVVAYVQELGRIEGVIVRRGIDWFAVELRVPSSRLRKLATRIDGLVRRQAAGSPERRSSERLDRDQDQDWTTLLLSDGREFEAGLIDVSSNSAALDVDVALPVGAAVTVGKRRAHVSRHFAGGIAVTFDPDGVGESFDRIETAGAARAPR